MPESMLRLLVLPFMEFDTTVRLDGEIEFYDLVIDRCAKNVLRQTTADRLSDLQRRHAVFVLTDASIRKSDFNHIDKRTNVYARAAHNCYARR